MPIEVDIAVSPSLHPGNIDAIDGVTADTAMHVAPARAAFQNAYDRLSDIHRARAAAESDPTLTEGARILQVAAFADKHQTAITKSFDASHAALTRTINSLEGMLSEPLKAKSERPGVAGEVRSYVKALTPAKRDVWFSERQKAKDFDSLEMILGSPGYLSGMTDDEQAVRTRMYHDMKSPDVAQRLKLLKAADELLTTRGGLIFGEIEKAIGTPWGTVARLKNSRTAAETAFILKA